MNEIAVLLVSYLLSAAVLTVYVYAGLRRPFTMTDLLWTPDDDVMGTHDCETLKFAAAVRWIPILNVMVVSVWAVLLLTSLVELAFTKCISRHVREFTDSIVFRRKES